MASPAVSPAGSITTCGKSRVGVELRFLSVFLALAGACVLVQAQDGAAVAAPETQSSPKVPVVAIIDSGVARTPELRNVLLEDYDFGASPARPAFRPRYDHGTMVATIMEREAKEPIYIISFRIDDLEGCPKEVNPPCQHDVRPIAAAIRKATELGVTAINISLNLKEDPLIVDAIRDASAHGIRVIMAAGNDGLDHPGNLRMAKAGYPNTILVGALDADGQPWKGTNRPQPDTPGYRYVWQWGVDVPTIMADGTRAIATGTSFAAPIETAKLLTQSQQPPATIALSS